MLPARLPNILLNGTTGGIAVGMATDIPPHNLREVAKRPSTLIERQKPRWTICWISCGAGYPTEAGSSPRVRKSAKSTRTVAAPVRMRAVWNKEDGAVVICRAHQVSGEGAGQIASPDAQ